MENLFDDLFDIMFSNQYQNIDNNSLNSQLDSIRNNFKHFTFILKNSDFEFMKSKFEDMPLMVKLCNLYIEKGIYPIHYIFKNKYISVEMLEFVLSNGFKLQFDDESKSVVSCLLELEIDNNRIFEILNFLKRNLYDFFKINHNTKFNILHDLAFYHDNDERIYDFVFNLNDNIDIDFSDREQFNSYSPLILAAKLDKIDYFKYLIKKNANINQSNDNNNSVLMYCCMNSNYELVKLLIEKGVDINFKDNQNDVALYYACGCEVYKDVNYDLVKLLLDNGANLDGNNSDGHTALHYACRSTPVNFDFKINFEVIKLLIQRGCKTNGIDSQGKTFLHYLIKYSTNCDEIKKIINMIELSNLQKNDLLIKFYHINNCKATFRNNDLYDSPSDSDDEYDEYEESESYEDLEDDDANELGEYEHISELANLNENSSNVTLDNVSTESVYEEKYNKMIEELNVIEYIKKNDDFKNNSCIICYDDDSSNRGLKCVNSHIFHEKCIYNWMKESKKYDCPLCTNEMILSKIYI